MAAAAATLLPAFFLARFRCLAASAKVVFILFRLSRDWTISDWYSRKVEGRNLAVMFPLVGEEGGVISTESV